MRRTSLLTAMLAASASASAIGTGTASAGTYEVAACAGPTLLIDNSWLPFNNNAAYLETSASCGREDVTEGSPRTSGLAAADVLGLSTNVPAGALAGWRFTAPAGDTISAIGIDRDLYDQSEGWVPQIVDTGGNPLPGETCPFNASNRGCEASGDANHAGLDTTSLAIELVCDPAPVQLTVCANGFFQHDGRVELNSATVTVSDDQPPQITSTTGSLFAGGLARGSLSGTIDGSDGSGVQSAGIYVDGAQVAQQALACDFTRPAPCPASSSNQFSLDTSTLANGTHQVQAAVVDAAGNQTLGSPVQITVENAAPTVPSTPPVPPLPPSPITPGKPTQASPQLQILSVTRTRRALHVRGTAAEALVGHVTVVVHYTRGGRSHSVQKTVRVAHGKWAVILGLPGGARTARVTVIHHGSARWLAQTVTRHVYHRARARRRLLDVARQRHKNRQGGKARLSATRGISRRSVAQR
jgi:hypothetical protein